MFGYVLSFYKDVLGICARIASKFLIRAAPRIRRIGKHMTSAYQGHIDCAW